MHWIQPGARRSRQTVRWCHRLLLTVLALVVSGCTRGPAAPSAAAVAPAQPGVPPTALAHGFAPLWVRNHRLTELWSGPTGTPGVVSFGATSQRWCAFQVVRPRNNPRVYVYNPYTRNYAWVDALALGPVAPPEHRAGPAPSGQSCAEAVYDGDSAPRTTDRRLVLALYYPWFSMATWGERQTTDLPQIPYASADPETIRRHVAWARESGIDVLVSAWYGPQDDNPTQANLRRLLDEAKQQNLKAAILLETDSATFYPDRASMARALRHFLDQHAAHPAYLRVNGKPVILVWRPIAVFGTDGKRVNQKNAEAVAAWRGLLDEVDPQRKALWIAEGDYFPFLEVFDGIFPYSIAWSPDPASQLVSYGKKVRAWNGQRGTQKLWIATAMPGYDDTRIRGRPGTFAVERANGDYYERTFRGAIASDPSWIAITSFNEWLEGTQIEPSQRYGRRYLDLTRDLAAAFKR